MRKPGIKDSSLALFHPLVRQWFLARLGTPTDIQARAWPEIAGGSHVLVSAPTGSGKTLTAFLWAINNFLTSKKPGHTPRVLYVSPLKALNNDIQRNLSGPLQELGAYFTARGEEFPAIRTAVRSGDTDPAERRSLVRHPPEILITTPESLNILLNSKTGQRVLQGIAVVILDEIHALADNRRGTYLITALERLVPLCGEFQRIALSATIKPLELAADFVGGYRVKECSGHYEYEKRRVRVVKGDMKKNYELRLNFPETAGGSRETTEWWPALARAFRDMIGHNRSTLFFANSRRMVEKVTRFINEGEASQRAYSHHGSLSKEIRAVVEKRFKDGELSAIVATSSLELGIDIGTVDQVVLIQPPLSIASAIQRIGRAGHGVGEISSGVFYPLHSHSLLEAAVIAAHIDSEEIETIKPVTVPLDVLAQVILSMTLLESRNLDELYGEVRASYPYHQLKRKEFDLVIDMLAGRYADSRIRELRPRLLVDRLKNTAKAREGAAMLLFLSGGVIPDRGYYNLRLADSKARIGELDEEFVWERSPGDAFPFGNQIWRIQRITPNDVEVTQVTRSNSLVPFWRAEEMNRSFFLSQKIAQFLEEADTGLKSTAFKEKLLSRHHMSEAAAEELIRYLTQQKEETAAPLPQRGHMLVEHFRDPADLNDAKQTVLHTLWGGRVNRPFALALASAWEEKYHYPLEVFVNNDCIMLNLPHSFFCADVLSLVKPSQVRRLLRSKLESTGFFGARFRENAQRALLLPRQSFNKRLPLWLNRLRSKKLLEAVSRYEDFPILIETWRQCLDQEFEIEILVQLIEEVQSGEIRVTEVITRKPSPFAESVIWRQTNKLLYQDDTPAGKLRTNLSDALIKEVLYSSSLRPRFSQELIRTLQDKLHRLAPGYAPSSAEELLHWIKERLYIPAHEWQELLAAIGRDHGLDTAGMVDSISDRLYRLEVGRELRAVIALENLPRVSRALNAAAEGAGIGEIFSEDGDETLPGLLDEWLRFYGPVSRDFLLDSLGVPEQRLGPALASLLDEGRIIIDEFRQPDKGTAEEICDSENLEILLRMRRSAQRPDFKPLDIDALPLFLAALQRLTSPGDSLEDLQQSLDSLFGYPAKAGLWESDILPARLSPYHPQWLDSAMRESELLWFGCGNERIGFCFDADYDLYAPLFEAAEKGDNQALSHAAASLEKIFAHTRARFSFTDLVAAAGLPGRELWAALWEMSWRGRISNDDYQTVRKGVMNRFRPEILPEVHSPRRRHSFNRWRNSRSFFGHWYALPALEPEALDALDQQEIIKDRIRQLFMRYGVLFREILANELPGLRWVNIFPVLRLMEFSGEIFTGHFFKGIPGLQFCSQAAFRILDRGLNEEAVYWMNAADPASLCGIGIEELKAALPHRLVTTHLVCHGKRLVLVSKKNGRELDFYVKPDQPGISEYLEFFKILIGRKFQPLKFIKVETVNREPVADSPYKEPLLAFGFERDYKALVLEKSY